MLLENILEYIREDPRRAKIVKVVGFIFLLLIVITILFNIPTSRPLQIRNIDLPGRSFARQDGKFLRYFNGLAFVKTNLQDTSSTIISKGMLLPSITQVYFVDDKGALVSFEGTRIYSSRLAKYNDSMHLDYFEKEAWSNLLWYVNFSTGDITPVEGNAPSTPQTVVGSNRTSIFYVAKQEQQNDSNYNDDDQESPRFSLFSLDTTTQQRTVLAALPEKTDAVLSVARCHDAGVCVISYANDSYNLLAYKDKKLISILTTKDTILPTNDLKKFVIVKGFVDYNDHGGDTPEDSTVVSKATAYEYDISTKKTSVLGAGVGEASHVFPLVGTSSLSLYSVNNSSELSIYHQTPSLLFLPTVSTTAVAILGEKIPVEVRDYAYDTGEMLLATKDNSVQYVGRGSIPPKPAEPPTNLVNTCATQYKSEAAYTAISSLYTLYIPYTDSFESTVDQLSKCLLRTPNSTFGYMFQVMGTDPDSGRIVTD